MTVRDLLTHRSGFLRHDAIWYGSTDSRELLLWKLRLVKPDHGFRAKYAYQNLMYLAAGQLVPAVVGKTWDEYLAEKFFAPLGMKSSITSVNLLPRAGNKSMPHVLIEDKLTEVPWRKNDHMGPAGSVISNAQDMAQWVRFQLGDGGWEKARLLNKATHKEMHTPQTVIRLEGARTKLVPDAHFVCYGLGWMLHDYQGKKIVEHGGLLDGFTSQLGLIPEEKLGVMIMCNHGATQLPRAVMFSVFDRYLNAKPRDWSTEMKKLAQLFIDQGKDDEKKEEKARVKDTKPTFPLERYAGQYSNGLHSLLKITHADSKLTAKFMGTTFDVQHWHYDTFRLYDVDKRFPKVLITFQQTNQGKIGSIAMNVFGEEIDLPRLADKAPVLPEIELTAEQRAKYVGVFCCALPNVEIEIELVKDKLKVIFPGDPPYVLRAVKEHTFQIAESPELSLLKFDVEKDVIRGLTLEQGTKSYQFTLKKMK
jgi:hypothetical protein